MICCTAATNQRIGFSIEPCGTWLVADATALYGCTHLPVVVCVWSAMVCFSSLILHWLRHWHYTAGCCCNALTMQHPLLLSFTASLQVFDLCDGRQVTSFQAAADTVNGVDFSPCLGLLATASGHRRFALLPADGWERDADSDSENHHQQQQQQEGKDTDDVSHLSMASWQPGGLCNSLRLWRCDAAWVAAAAAEAGVDGQGLAAAEAAEGMELDQAAAPCTQ
jgi:hypothetical protein